MAWRGRPSWAPLDGGMTRFEWRGANFLVPKAASMTVVGTGDQPDLFLRVEIRDDAPVVTEVNVLAKPHGVPVRDAHLDKLTLDAYARRTMLELAISIDADGRMDHLQDGSKEMYSLVGGLVDAQERTRRGQSPQALEEVARVYKAHLDSSPTAAVAAMFGLSQRTAARRVKAAEDAGLLPATTKGKKRGK